MRKKKKKEYHEKEYHEKKTMKKSTMKKSVTYVRLTVMNILWYTMVVVQNKKDFNFQTYLIVTSS